MAAAAAATSCLAILLWSQLIVSAAAAAAVAAAVAPVGQVVSNFHSLDIWRRQPAAGWQFLCFRLWLVLKMRPKPECKCQATLTGHKSIGQTRSSSKIKAEAAAAAASIIATSFAIVAECWTKPVFYLLFFCIFNIFFGTENVGSKMQQQQQSHNNRQEVAGLFVVAIVSEWTCASVCVCEKVKELYLCVCVLIFWWLY